MTPARARVVSLATGSLLVLAAAAPALTAAAAEEEKGSGLGSFALAANAPVVQVREDDGNRCAGQPSATAGCEGVIPETVSTLSNGPVGFGLSSIVWPGTLAGNLGSTIILAGNGQVPEGARALNSPIRAEARTGGEPKVTNTDTPGTVMSATATDDEVTAAATIGQALAPGLGTFGDLTSRTRVALTGVKTAVAEAQSKVADLDIGGVVKIQSVTSSAKATTDGVTGKAAGQTTVSGATIAGVPVTFDDKGLQVAGTSTPLGATASDTVNAAVKAAGMTIAVSRPTTTIEGGNVSYSAGSLVFFWQQQPETSMTVVLGGATVSLAATQGLDLVGTDLPATDTPPVDPGGLTGGTAGVPGTPGTPGDLPVEAPLDAGTAPVSGAGVPPAAAPQVAEPEISARRFDLPEGISPATLVLGLVGAGLLAAGFRRLPDRLLEQTPDTSCALRGQR